MSLLFRPLSAADRTGVELLCARSFDHGDYIPGVYDAWLASGDAHFYGAFDPGGDLLGIGRVRALDGGRTAWCEGVRVAPDRRGGGIGRAILQHALEWALGRGVLRARAAVDSANEASMGLFAGCGFRPEVSYRSWDAAPAPGGRLPRPLPLAELEWGYAIVERSIPYRLARGTCALGWTVHDLDLDRFSQHVERGEVLLAGDGMGALGIVGTLDEESSDRLIVAFLAGAPVAVARLLRGIRTLAHLRRLEGPHVAVPADAGLDGMLAHGGFSRWSGQMVLQQRDMGTGH